MKKKELNKKLEGLIKEQEEFRVYNYHRAPKQSEYHRGQVAAYYNVKELINEPEKKEKEL